MVNAKIRMRVDIGNNEKYCLTIQNKNPNTSYEISIRNNPNIKEENNFILKNMIIPPNKTKIVDISRYPAIPTVSVIVKADMSLQELVDSCVINFEAIDTNGR